MINGSESVSKLKKRIDEIRGSQETLDGELISIEVWLDGLIGDMDSLNERLRDFKSRKNAAKSWPAKAAPDSAGDDFKGQLEKLLLGSMEGLENRLSERILKMLKELKGAVGPARAAKMREIKEAVDEEVVDLSRLFVDEKIESNIDEIGVEEKESKGIQKSLDRLRRMREGKKDGDNKLE